MSKSRGNTSTTLAFGGVRLDVMSDDQLSRLTEENTRRNSSKHKTPKSTLGGNMFRHRSFSLSTSPLASSLTPYTTRARARSPSPEPAASRALAPRAATPGASSSQSTDYNRTNNTTVGGGGVVRMDTMVEVATDGSVHLQPLASSDGRKAKLQPRKKRVPPSSPTSVSAASTALPSASAPLLFELEGRQHYHNLPQPSNSADSTAKQRTPARHRTSRSRGRQSVRSPLNHPYRSSSLTST